MHQKIIASWAITRFVLASHQHNVVVIRHRSGKWPYGKCQSAYTLCELHTKNLLLQFSIIPSCLPLSARGPAAAAPVATAIRTKHQLPQKWKSKKDRIAEDLPFHNSIPHGLSPSATSLNESNISPVSCYLSFKFDILSQGTQQHCENDKWREQKTIWHHSILLLFSYTFFFYFLSLSCSWRWLVGKHSSKPYVL